MRNKIEILRALCFTKEDLETIKNVPDGTFTDLEIEFMVEFKKIYELGLNQLEVFINKLDEEGKDLQTWDIDYYVTLLLNGPLGSYAKKLAENKKYFIALPNILGNTGNSAVTLANTTLYLDNLYPLSVAVDTFNSIPDFIQGTVIESTEIVERMFRSSLNASIVNDNTLPIADKAPQKRYLEEDKGDWVKRSNASYSVKDSFYRVRMADTRSKIFDKVKELIGEEHYRIYEDHKRYSPFDDEYNTSTAINYQVKEEITENDITQEVTTDLFGNVYDSDDRRKSVLKVPTPEKDKEYVLNTVEGQLGS